jgi:peptidoglycan/xylan/chitin deacetylase (PgdA/CDA1 family)
VADNTPAVLKALADECTKGMFFPIGKHATYHPEILKQVAAAGHTIGSHTWSHANLNNKKLTEQQARTRSKRFQRGEMGARRGRRRRSSASRRCSIRRKW